MGLSRIFRSLVHGWLVPLLAAMGLMGAAAAPAWAAADLVVNLTPDKPDYLPGEIQTWTMTVSNRGTDDVAGVPLKISLPSMNGNGVDWAGAPYLSCSTQVVPPATGFACPAAFTRADYATTGDPGSARSVTASADIPYGGTLVVKIAAPGGANAIGYQVGTATATLANDSNPATNTATNTVYVVPPRASYGIRYDSGMPAQTIPNTPVTVLYTVYNNGTDVNSLLLNLNLQANPTTASDTQSGQAFPSNALLIQSVSCVAGSETGGASCANFSNSTLFPVPGSYVMSRITNMPGTNQSPQTSGSSVQLAVTYTMLDPYCTMGTAPVARTLQLSTNLGSYASAYDSYFATPAPSGAGEDFSLAADNQTVQSSVAMANICQQADLYANIGQSGSQAAGVGPNGQYSYTFTYGNTGPAIAVNAPINLMVYQAITGVAAPAAGTASCVVTTNNSGQAACPSAASLVSSNSAYLYYAATTATLGAGDVITITVIGQAPGDFPAGYTGSTCRPFSIWAMSQIRPPGTVIDTSYNPQSYYGIPGGDNNGLQISTPLLIGTNCPGNSYNVSATKTGPYADAAATQLIQGPLSLGQVVYWKLTYANRLSPGLPLTHWTLGDSNSLSFASGGHPTTSITSAPNWFVPAPGQDATGTLPYAATDLCTLSGYNCGSGVTQPSYGGDAPPPYSGITCTSTNGGVCPTQLIPVGSATGTAGPSQFMFTDNGSQTWPAGGSIELIVPMQLPSGVCSQDVAYAQNGSNYSNWRYQTTSPPALQGSYNDDSAKVDYSVSVPACPPAPPPLTVTKTILPPASETLIPANGQVSFQVVLTNSTSTPLDLPHFQDQLFTYADSAAANATLISSSCTADAGASCPAQPLVLNVDVDEYRGTQTPSELPQLYEQYGYALKTIDVIWGSPGASTIPAGKSVTFTLNYQFDVSLPAATLQNQAQLSADTASTTASSWTPGTDDALIVPPVIGTASLTKSVAPISVKPGQLATYTVVIVNPTQVGIDGLYFSDKLPAALQPANPAGYAIVGCRTMTTADNPRITGQAACPSFGSDASGISAGPFSLPAASGVVLTYSAIAAGNQSVPNTAQLGGDPKLGLSAGVSAQANVLLTPNPPGLAKAFNPPGPVAIGSTVSLIVTVTNTDDVALSGLAFTDTYPAGLLNTATSVASNTCGGTVTVAAGSLQLAGGTLGAGTGTSCKIQIDGVRVTAAAVTNTIASVTTNESAPGGPASASIGLLARITGTIFWDQNANGSRDGGEGALPSGVNPGTVTLTNTQGGQTYTVAVAADGSYAADLPAGSYTVKVDNPPAGYANTSNNDGATAGSTQTVSATAGESAAANPIGYYQRSLSIHIYGDANGNGSQDGSDAGLSGIRVTVTGPNGFSTTAVTDAQGNISIPNPVPGSYAYTVDTTTVPSGWKASAPTQGSNSGTVVVAAGSGAVPPAIIGYPRSGGGTSAVPVPTLSSPAWLALLALALLGLAGVRRQGGKGRH